MLVALVGVFHQIRRAHQHIIAVHRLGGIFFEQIGFALNLNAERRFAQGFILTERIFKLRRQPSENFL